MSEATVTAGPEAPPAEGRPSPAERAKRGKEARSRMSRSEHAAWTPPADRADPVEVLQRQAAARVPELVPIRYGRMMASPFAFYRGGAAVMAADLASVSTPGLVTQLCGDAHLSNFGGFASPDRELVFDLNDFDETLPGPFEWDVKRLAASIEVAGREAGFSDGTRLGAVMGTVREYRQAIRRFAEMRDLDVWYARLDAPAIVDVVGQQVSQKEVKRLRKAGTKARSKDSIRALERLTERVHGQSRIVHDPPLIVPIEKLLPDGARGEFVHEIRKLMAAYRRTLSGAARHLLDGYRYEHMARKVVGVGSVGTRAWIVLSLGRDDQDPLFLQVKEAEASVLEPYAGRSRFANHGRRVVEGQWLMQAASDIFLGWIRADGIDGGRRDFYVRQLWDWKRSADIETMTELGFEAYGRMCGWTLARAHARGGDAVAIGAYLGRGGSFERALAAFAAAYADQNERDYRGFVEAVDSGAVEVIAGV